MGKTQNEILVYENDLEANSLIFPNGTFELAHGKQVFRSLYPSIQNAK